MDRPPIGGGLSTQFMSPKTTVCRSGQEKRYGATCAWTLVNRPVKGPRPTFAAP